MAVGFVLFVGGACAGAHRATTVHVAERDQRTLVPRRPPRFHELRGIAPSATSTVVFGLVGRSGGGLWLVADDASGHISATRADADGSHVVRSRPIDFGGPLGADTVAITDSQGNLWVAGARRIARVGAGSLAVRVFPLMEVPVGSHTNKQLPPPLRGSQFLSGLAQDPTSGAVYIARQNATDLLRLEPSRGEWATVALPLGYQNVHGIAVDADGTIAVALNAADGNLDKIGIKPRRGAWKIVTVPAALFVVADGPDFVTGATSELNRLDANGKITATQHLAQRIFAGPEPTTAPHSHLIAEGPHGVELIAPDGTSRQFPFPPGRCGHSLIGGFGAPPRAPPTTTAAECPIEFALVAADRTGNLYGATTIGNIYALNTTP